MMRAWKNSFSAGRMCTNSLTLAGGAQPMAKSAIQSHVGARSISRSSSTSNCTARAAGRTPWRALQQGKGIHVHAHFGFMGLFGAVLEQALMVHPMQLVGRLALADDLPPVLVLDLLQDREGGSQYQHVGL